MSVCVFMDILSVKKILYGNFIPSWGIGGQAYTVSGCPENIVSWKNEESSYLRATMISEGGADAAEAGDAAPEGGESCDVPPAPRC